MLLAIDIGNTNMEFGFFKGDTLTASFRLGTTNRDVTSDEIGMMIRQYMSLNSLDHNEVEDTIITSVVPQVMYSMNNAIIKYFGKTPFIVGENIDFFVPNHYSNPKEVGADRLVNTLAAYHKYGGSLIVVDFGTATTFDAIGAKGEYLGGAIYPGIKVSMDALFQKAAKLPRVEIVNPQVNIGKTTAESMQAGVVYGYVGAVRNICRIMKQDLGEDTKIIGTGGLSVLFGREDVFDIVDKTLTLEGLRLIYERHKEQN